ncbi:unnamed protein product, partial [Mesorhabditis spiculigera]
MYKAPGLELMLFGIYDQNLLLQNQSFYPFWLASLLCELFGSSITIGLGLCLLHVAKNSRVFNKKLIHIIWLFMAKNIIGEIARFLLMLYQFRVIPVQGDILADLPLFFLSACRTFVYCSEVMFVVEVLCERCMAIVFVRDYEYMKRVWLEWIIFTYSNLNCLIVTLAFHFLSVQQHNFMFKLMLPLTLCCIIGTLIRFNNKISERLEKFDIRRYSLSTKFQVVENSKALKILQWIFLGHSIFCLFGSCLFTIPNIIFENETPELELSTACLEAVQSLYGVFYTISLLILIPPWRRKLFDLAQIRRRKSCRVQFAYSQPKILAVSPAECDEHFNHLKEIWGK